MKMLLNIVLILVLSYSIDYSQEQAFGGELKINFENLPATWSLTVKIEAYGTVWDQYHDITSNYNGGDTSYSQNSSRYSHASDLDWHYQGWDPCLSLGLYEVSVWEGSSKKAWFFIDYRTSHLPYAASLQSVDVELDYDFVNKDLEMTYPNIGNVTNATYYSIWELKALYELQTDDLEDYWDNCLVSIDDGSDHPRIIWGKHPDDDNSIVVDNYKVYRGVTTGAPPYNPTYYHIATRDDDVYTFTDNNYTLGGPLNLHYKITALYEDLARSINETSPSNSIIVSGGLFKHSESGNNANNEFKLEQNYPNPFNPSTIINYTLPENNFVSLKVYDVLGSEIATLINDFLDAGSHYVEFNSANLPSGIYFYKIQSGSFIETRKMILQK